MIPALASPPRRERRLARAKSVRPRRPMKPASASPGVRSSARYSQVSPGPSSTSSSQPVLLGPARLLGDPVEHGGLGAHPPPDGHALAPHQALLLDRGAEHDRL